MISKLILIALSIFFGLVFLFDIDTTVTFSKRKTSRTRIGKKENAVWSKISEFQGRVSLLLLVTDSKLTAKRYFQISRILVLIGISAGIFYSNILICIVLGFGLPFFQYQMLLKKKHDVVRDHNEKLEIYMSIVTNSYMQSEDIESAITDSYRRMDSKEAAARPFEAFIGQSAGNANIKQCILDMKQDVDNLHFDQWCDKLVICRENSKLKYVLPYVMNRMRRKRTLDSETVTICHSNFKDFLAVCIITLVMTLIVPMFNPTWKSIVSHTAIGKAATAFVIIVVLIATAYVVKVSRPAGETS